MSNFPVYRKMELGEDLAITMPAAMWLQFVAAYASTDWQCGAASHIAYQVTRSLLDPVYLSEREAADQAAVDEQQAVMARMFGMPGPQFPSSPEGLE